MFEVRNRVAFEDYLDSLLRMTESDDLEFKSAALKDLCCSQNVSGQELGNDVSWCAKAS